MARTPGDGAALTNLLQRPFTSASQAASTESDIEHACVYMYVCGVEASHIKGLKKFHLRNGH